MKLNKFEFLLMNSPIRALVQEMHEVRILRDLTSMGTIERALEIGCGNGHGTKLIKKYFAPKFIDAIDLDERMIEIAKGRTHDPSIGYYVMDASKLDFPNETFDAIFDFGIIHHIPNWRDCISEMNRVLKPGGEVILEELSTETFNKFPGRLWKKLLDHPYDSMFSEAQFLHDLRAEGFVVAGFRQSYPLMLIKQFSLVAKKQSTSSLRS